MNKRWIYALLAVVVVTAVGTAFLDRPDPANAPRVLRYSDFVEAVTDNQVARVLIAPDRGTAQVVENDGQRAVVNMAPDKELFKLLTDHNVDIAVQPSREPAAWQQAVGSLLFPLLLLGGLFFLLRRAQGGGGNRSWPSDERKVSAQIEPKTQTILAYSRVNGISHRPSISGWLAYLLGLYLVGSGTFNIIQLVRGGSDAYKAGAETLRQYGIDSGLTPATIVASYVVGAPIFVGSGLMVLGSIARDMKRSRQNSSG